MFISRDFHSQRILQKDKVKCSVDSLKSLAEKALSFLKNNQSQCVLSNEKKPGWLFDTGEEILPNYKGIIMNIISQYKDPY